MNINRRKLFGLAAVLPFAGSMPAVAGTNSTLPELQTEAVVSFTREDINRLALTKYSDRIDYSYKLTSMVGAKYAAIGYFSRLAKAKGLPLRLVLYPDDVLTGPSTNAYCVYYGVPRLAEFKASQIVVVNLTAGTIHFKKDRTHDRYGKTYRI